MRRGRGLVIGAAVAALSAGAALAADGNAPTAYFRSSLAPDGWLYRGTAADQVIFVKQRSSAGPYIRLWARYEFDEPQTSLSPPFLSMMTYNEFDCAEGRYRALQESFFPSNNLLGKPIAIKNVPTEWAFIPPDTIASSLLRAACS